MKMRKRSKSGLKSLLCWTGMEREAEKAPGVSVDGVGVWGRQEGLMCRG